MQWQHGCDVTEETVTSDFTKAQYIIKNYKTDCKRRKILCQENKVIWWHWTWNTYRKCLTFWSDQQSPWITIVRWFNFGETPPLAISALWRTEKRSILFSDSDPAFPAQFHSIVPCKMNTSQNSTKLLISPEKKPSFHEWVLWVTYVVIVVACYWQK